MANKILSILIISTLCVNTGVSYGINSGNYKIEKSKKISLIIKDLNSPIINRQLKAIESATNFGTTIIAEELLKLFGNTKSPVSIRILALEALLSIDPFMILPYLPGIIENNEAQLELREKAIEAIGNQGYLFGFGALARVVVNANEDSRELLRIKAIEAFSKNWSFRIFEPLEQVLENTNDSLNVRRAAIKAIGRLGGIPGIRILVNIKNEYNLEKDIIRAIRSVITKVNIDEEETEIKKLFSNNSATRFLIGSFKRFKNDPKIQRDIIYVLGFLENEITFEFLKDLALKPGTSEFKSEAILEFGNAPLDWKTDVLTTILANEGEINDVRVTALMEFCQISKLPNNDYGQFADKKEFLKFLENIIDKGKGRLKAESIQCLKSADLFSRFPKNKITALLDKKDVENNVRIAAISLLVEKLGLTSCEEIFEKILSKELANRRGLEGEVQEFAIIMLTNVPCPKMESFLRKAIENKNIDVVKKIRLSRELKESFKSQDNAIFLVNTFKNLIWQQSNWQIQKRIIYFIGEILPNTAHTLFGKIAMDKFYKNELPDKDVSLFFEYPEYIDIDDLRWFIRLASDPEEDRSIRKSIIIGLGKLLKVKQDPRFDLEIGEMLVRFVNGEYPAVDNDVLLTVFSGAKYYLSNIASHNQDLVNSLLEVYLNKQLPIRIRANAGMVIRAESFGVQERMRRQIDITDENNSMIQMAAISFIANATLGDNENYLLIIKIIKETTNIELKSMAILTLSKLINLENEDGIFHLLDELSKISKYNEETVRFSAVATLKRINNPKSDKIIKEIKGRGDPSYLVRSLIES